MKLEEPEKTWPNGLHDSKVSQIAVDYQQRKLTLDLDVWTGDMTNNRPELREAYRRGHMLISGLLFAVMEPPDPRYPFLNSDRLTVDGCDMSKNLSAALMNSLPAGAFFRSLWVHEWNAFIHIASRNAELIWLDGSGAQGTEPEARS
jgi:hypothetical protein